MKVYLTVDKRNVDGAVQVSIGNDRIGYRIAGPKYDGSGKQLLKKELTASERDEIRSWLENIE
jgi:hypothetical protein